jgi:sigma-B regulation protein RsbU (phosphoserine phosphatase)
MLELKAQRRVLDHQLHMAQEIQGRLTPSVLPKLPGVEVAVHYQPAMWVGGDYCDVWLLPDQRLALAVGDVSGKGLPAAMVMANLQAALRTAASFCPRPSDAMEHVNRHLGQHLPERMFVTLFFGVFEPRGGQLEYVNAGHIPPWLIGPGPRVASLGRPRDRVLGVSSEGFTTESATIASGAGLLAVTDGVTDAVSPEGEEFGLVGVERHMQTAEAHTARQIVERATEAVARFRGLAPQQDDLTIVGLHRSAGDTQAPATPRG